MFNGETPKINSALLITGHSLSYWELASSERITFFAKLILSTPYSINDSGKKGGQENV